MLFNYCCSKSKYSICKLSLLEQVPVLTNQCLHVKATVTIV